MSKDKIAVARGDGIGPEIMDAVLGILEAAGAEFDIEEVTVGEQAYNAGEAKGISDADFEKLQACRAFLKAPLNTPSGKGYSSVNVAIRKRFDLFANIRPSLSLEPVIKSPNGKTDMVIVRENLEDLYAGIEYKPTPDVSIGRKVITKSESERISRMAFEYARANGREKVTVIAKDNIQKMTDGTNFHDVFDKVAEDYPDIKAESYIADIGLARLGARPGDFDVVVTQNMYGDIGSDVIGESLGSIGLSGSANIGEKFAMFEAVHGTAPDIAGKGIANPSGLLMASVMMLNYIGQSDVAETVHNAFLKTLEDGIYTGDVYWRGWGREEDSRMAKLMSKVKGDKSPVKQRVGSAEFAEAIKARLGQKPSVLTPVDYSNNTEGFSLPETKAAEERVEFITTGVDIDVEYDGAAEDLAGKVEPLLEGTGSKLAEIRTVRGDKVWPEKQDCFETDCLTLRIAFEDAANKSEPEKQMAAVNILGAFSQANDNLKWREVRALTQNAVTLENNFR